MSSSFMNFTGAVNVSNMMFWRACEFALEIAKKKEKIADGVIEKFAKLKSTFGPTPDVDIDEYFTIDELEFWSNIFSELADQIFNGKIGNQDNQEWQVWTIWTACSISKLFHNSFKYRNHQTDKQYIKENKYRKLGQLSLKSNDAEMALKNLEIALEANPDSVITNYLLGLTYKKLNQNEKANSFLEKAEKMGGWIDWF